MKWALILLILLSGCGTQLSIDPAFESYVTRWNQLYPNNKVAVNTQFANLIQNGIAGEWDGIQVWIDTATWNKLTDFGPSTVDGSGRQQLIFHEWGHAMFGYGHDFNCYFIYDSSQIVQCLIPNSPAQLYYVPRSIMYPWIFGDSNAYQDYLDYYLQQLGVCITCTTYVNGNNGLNQKRNQSLSTIRID